MPFSQKLDQDFREFSSQENHLGTTDYEPGVD